MHNIFDYFHSKIVKNFVVSYSQFSTNQRTKDINSLAKEIQKKGVSNFNALVKLIESYSPIHSGNVIFSFKKPNNDLIETFENTSSKNKRFARPSLLTQIFPDCLISGVTLFKCVQNTKYVQNTNSINLSGVPTLNIFKRKFIDSICLYDSEISILLKPFLNLMYGELVHLFFLNG